MSHIKSLSPQQAYALLQNNPSATLIDIRSSMEYLFVGHPKDAVHIPWIDEPDWEINPDFVSEVTGLLETKDAKNPFDLPAVLICRSGKRTLEAGAALIKAGFTNVIHIDEGFEGERDEQFHRSTTGGWRFHGLPWEQC